MDELVPVIFSATLGAMIWLTTCGKTRHVFSVIAVLVSGVAATILSGEYQQSWIYLLFDFGEAAVGLVIGYMAGIQLLTSGISSRTIEEMRLRFGRWNRSITSPSQ